MATFPGTVERFLALTPREAVEEITLYQAMMEYRAKVSESYKNHDENNPYVEHNTDEDAREAADTPIDTGDPELDAIEAAETDPDRDVNWLEEYKRYKGLKK